MKIKSTKLIAMLLVVAMMFSFSSVAFATTGGSEPETIKYVSIGDSMTNGYGFTGYNQDMHTIDRNEVHLTPDDYNFFDGKGVYGDGSYANTFAEYLENYGEVEHTKLALSAFRPEDLLFLIDDSISKTDITKLPIKDGYFNNSWAYVWDACEDYLHADYAVHEYLWAAHEPGTSCGLSGYCAYYLANITQWPSVYNDEPMTMKYYEQQFDELSTYFKESLIDADVISLALGNASFDAYFMDRLFMIWEAMDASSWNYYKCRNEITIDDIKEQLTKTADEDVLVDQLYATMKKVIKDVLGDDNYDALQMDRVCQLMTYCVFSYMYSYERVINWIGDHNSDATVMLVGLLNSHDGISLVDGDMTFDMGESMGELYSLMNDYVAELAADYKAEHDEFTGNFLFVKQPDNPEMIAEVIDDLAAANWGLIDNNRLDGSIIRYKTVGAFNSVFLAGLKNSGVAVDGAVAQALSLLEANPSLTVEQANAAAANYGLSAGQILGTLMFLGAEKAMVTSLESGELEVSALVAFADGSIAKALENVKAPAEGATIEETIAQYEAFFAGDEMMPMVRFFALNKVGNGIAAHPTPSNHDRLAVNMIAAYEQGIEAGSTGSVVSVFDNLKDAFSAKGYLTEDEKIAIIEEVCAYVEDGALSSEDEIAIAKFIIEEVYTYENDDNQIDIIETIYNVLDDCGQIDAETAMTAKTIGKLYAKLFALEFINNAQATSIVDFAVACLEDKVLSDEETNNILRFAYYTLTGNASFNPMMSRTVGTLDDDQKILLIQTIVDVLEDSNPEAVAQVAPTLAVYYELEDKGLVTSGDAVEVFEYLFNGATTSDPQLKFDLTDETVLQDVAETVVNMVLEDKPADVKIQIMATVAGTLGGSITGGTEMPEIPSIDDLPAEVKEIYNYLSANGYITEAQKNAVIDYALDIAFGNVTLPADKAGMVITVSEKLYEIFMMNPNLTAEDILDIAEFIAGVYEEEIVTTLKDAYAKAYAKAVEAGLIAAAQNGLDEAIFAFESAIATIDAYYEENKDDVAPELAETVANLKAAAITELEACIETATALKSILDNDTLTRDMLVEIYNLQDQLALHCQNAVDFARQTNADLTPFVNAGVEKVLEQVKVLSDIAADAYDMLSVVPEEYIQFCEQVTAYAEAIDPRLAAAVAKFLAETPAEAMEILYAYGEEAVTKLVTDAVAAYGDIYEAAVLFLDTIVKYGLDMHETLKTNPELQQLLDIISENLKTAKAIAHGALDGDVFDLAMQYKDLTKEQIYQLVYGEIMLAYNTAYPLVLSALHAIHPQAEASVRLAYDTFVKILTTSYEFADGYLSWLEDRTDILDAELFASIMGNVTELLETVHEILEELGYEATHAEYCICGGEHDYVALGGNLTVAPSYAEIFAEALAAAGADETLTVHNLAYEGEELLTAKNLVDYVKSHAAAIAEAELITFNMDATDTIWVMMEALEGNFVDWSEYFDGNVLADFDWTAGMSEKQAAIAEKYAAKICDEVKTTIEEEFDLETLKAIDPYVEILVYAAVSYGIETYEALETIAAINPDALITVVGMVNPFVGTTINYNGEIINVGEIFDYAIEATDLFNKYYAILSGNVTFVSAAGAETVGALAPTEIVIPENLADVNIGDLAEAFYAVLEGAYLTADGHADVCEALLNAIALDGEHNYGDWIVVSVADIGVEGYKYRVCSDCGHKDEVTEPAKLPTIIPLVPFEPSVGGNEFVHFHCDGGANCHCRDFEDLDNTMWYHQGVCYMIDKGHMIGIGDNKWGPEQVITRAEIATILWRIAGSKVVDYAMDFSDVEADMWYTEAIEWAVSEEIFLGYGDGTFGPNDQITREQMVTVMYRYELDNGKKITADFDMTTVSDAEEISEWAVEAMTWALDCGLIIGTDVDVPTASPLQNASRAEVAMIFYRKLDNLLK